MKNRKQFDSERLLAEIADLLSKAGECKEAFRRADELLREWTPAIMRDLEKTEDPQRIDRIYNLALRVQNLIADISVNVVTTCYHINH